MQRLLPVGMFWRSVAFASSHVFSLAWKVCFSFSALRAFVRGHRAVLYAGLDTYLRRKCFMLICLLLQKVALRHRASDCVVYSSCMAVFLFVSFAV